MGGKIFGSGRHLFCGEDFVMKGVSETLCDEDLERLKSVMIDFKRQKSTCQNLA